LIGLIATAAGIGAAHTAAGPDHYLPFGMMAAARRWSALKTLQVTLICGLGHLAGSVALGAIGVALGLALSGLEWIEAVRGELAAWALIAFGLAYAAWGFRRARRAKTHTHWHAHGPVVHNHTHDHFGAHAHPHLAPAETGPAAASPAETAGRAALAWAPWSLFVIFVLGPCEPLIPVLMYPAIAHSAFGVAAVTAAFGAATLITMCALALACRRGLEVAPLGALERHVHVFAGLGVAACGASIAFLGL